MFWDYSNLSASILPEAVSIESVAFIVELDQLLKTVWKQCNKFQHSHCLFSSIRIQVSIPETHRIFNPKQVKENSSVS